jgi:hypothetical protein
MLQAEHVYEKWLPDAGYDGWPKHAAVKTSIAQWLVIIKTRKKEFIQHVSQMR